MLKSFQTTINVPNVFHIYFRNKYTQNSVTSLFKDGYTNGVLNNLKSEN